ncbi:type II toxin-antitoxin system VapC family toxin [Candidatus Bathyarchaeota archaeon]|nr:type II toxin-antitoxin system VapC family toxin [Candidatus Bathyarchaeota archaeon]
MSYLFDSSAIFKAIVRNTVEVLSKNYTIELARYELCNILWKESILYGRVNCNEAKKLMELVKSALSLMKVFGIECHEEEVITAAEKLQLTFYDASYVFYAKKMNLTLITEDEKIINKAKPYIKTLKLNDVVP